MYLRDLIDTGGVASTLPSGGGEYPTYSNSIIISIKKGYRKDLVISLKKENDNVEGLIHIKLKKNGNDEILEKIFNSTKLAGKTIDELRDTKLSDL